MTNLEMYETHLNEKCKIHFKWFEDTKELKYRDLTDPEKKIVFLKHRFTPTISTFTKQ